MKYFSLVFAFVSVMASTVAYAQDANAQKALQKAQFMLRQSANEKVEFQTQLDALKQQVDQLTRELAATKSGATSAQQKTEEKYTGVIAQWKQRDSEVSAELLATKEQLKQQLAQRKDLESRLQKQADNFSVCYENNKKLYDINNQLLSRYESKGFVDVAKQKEPFTGIKQVEVENLVQDYRYQLDDLQVKAEQAEQKH